MDGKYNRIGCESLEEFDNRFERWFKMEKWLKFHFLKNFYRNYCIKYQLFPTTQEVFKKRFKTITEIYSNNNIQNIDDLESLVDEYYNVKSFIRRLDIRYGEGRGGEYSKLLSKKSFENDKSTHHSSQIEFALRLNLNKCLCSRMKAMGKYNSKVDPSVANVL